MVVAASWYVPRPVAVALERLLACSWTAVPSGEHLLVPDGCIDMLWLSARGRKADGRHGEVWVCGPERTAWRFQLPIGSTAAGVRFRPGVGPAVLRFDARVVANRRVRLDELIDRGSAACLKDELLATNGLASAADVLERFVARVAVDADAVDALLAERILQQLLASPRASQRELAESVGFTTRQLHRRSHALFGYGTSTLARLLRFHRFLALSYESEVVSSVSTIAARAALAGYADHAHLVRDCRAITGMSPIAFLANSFPTFPDMSDPYKTVVPLLATIR